jgi:hypothetical protein
LIESSNSKIDFSQVLSSISQENWEDLPPGGGLHAKLVFFSSKFNFQISFLVFYFFSNRQALMEEIYNKLTAKVI